MQNSLLQTNLPTQKKAKEILRQRLIQRENLWLQKLDTIYPKVEQRTQKIMILKTLELLFHVQIFQYYCSRLTTEVKFCNFIISKNSLQNSNMSKPSHCQLLTRFFYVIYIYIYIYISRERERERSKHKTSFCPSKMDVSRFSTLS